MAYSIELLPTAAAELAATPPPVRKRLARRIQSLAVDPRPPGSSLLQAEGRLYRERAGDYRIIYRVEDRRLIVVIIKIGHRREIYRRLKG